MARLIVIFQNIEKLSIFKFAYFYRLSNDNQFYYCFILDITCALVHDIELVCIWFRLDSMSIFISIVKHTISFYNYHVFALFPWQPIPVLFHTSIFLCNKSDVVLLYAYNLISIEYQKLFVKVCLIFGKNGCFSA